MIEVRDFRKTYGSVIAADRVSFTAEDGKITTLLGVNGSGKTTTLRAVAGLICPDRGKVKIDGIDVTADPLPARNLLGFVPDEFGLYPRLTAREHLEYYAAFHHLSGPRKDKAVRDIIALLNMNDIADRRTEGFSLGERSKVALARAMVHGPRNFMLDEPTRGLDVMNIRLLREVLKALKKEGRCILFSSHVMGEVEALSDKVVIITQGRVVAEGTPAELRRKTGTRTLEDAFVELTREKEQAA